MTAPRRRPTTLPVLLPIALLLAACVPAVPTVAIAIDVPAPDLEAARGELRYASGILEVVDDLIVLAPGAEVLRADAVTHEEQRASAMLAEVTGITAPAAKAPQGTDAAARPGRAAPDGDEWGFATYASGLFSGALISSFLNRDGIGSIPVGGTEHVVNAFGDYDVTRTDDHNVEFQQQSTHVIERDGARIETSIDYVIGGQICPGPDGGFDAQVRVLLGATGGAGAVASVQQETVTRLTGTLGENASPESMHLEAQQRSTETRADGSELTVATRQRSDWDGRSLAGLFTTDGAPVELVAATEGAADADIRRLAERGQSRALAQLFGQAVSLITTMWQDGGCVRIDAQAPAVVPTSSTTTIPVDVLTLADRSSVRANVTLTLTGDESLSATSLRSPESFAYLAPDAQGGTALVKLEATSRQGGAKLELRISTAADHYAITGGSYPFAGTGEWCQGASAFSVVGPAGTTEFALFGVDGGTIQFVGVDDGGGWVGSGTWSVVTDDQERPVRIVAEYSGTHYTGASVSAYQASMSFELAPKDVCDAA